MEPRAAVEGQVACGLGENLQSYLGVNCGPHYNAEPYSLSYCFGHGSVQLSKNADYFLLEAPKTELL